VCSNTSPVIYAADLACTACPGSSVYVYESESGFVCCSCTLTGGDDFADFVCKTEGEMHEHLLAHDAKGDHVRRSLLAEARNEELVEVHRTTLADLLGGLR